MKYIGALWEMEKRLHLLTNHFEYFLYAYKSMFHQNNKGKKTNIHPTTGFSKELKVGRKNGLLLQENRPVQKKKNNTGLPDNIKSGIENLSGHSMDDVKVHYNSSQPAQLNAHAFVQGHIALGQEKHLPHEAWHVVQQKLGRVKPTKQLKGKVNVNDDAGLEKEADVMGPYAIKLNPFTNRNLAKGSLLTQRIDSVVAQRNPLDKLKETSHRVMNGVGLAGIAAGAATAAILMSNPIGWGAIGALSGGAMVSTSSGYMFGSSAPAPVNINGHFVDGSVAFDYAYSVTFKGSNARIMVDFYFDGSGLKHEDREAYIRKVQQRVDEFFGNRINVEHGNRTYLIEKIIVNAEFRDQEVRIGMDN
jgi:hypothetical protein